MVSFLWLLGLIGSLPLRRKVNVDAGSAMRQPFSVSDSVNRKVKVLAGTFLDAI